MKNCYHQQRLLSETLNTVNHAIIDEKGYYINLKLTNMTRVNNNNSGRAYKSFDSVKLQEPNLNIWYSISWMMCGNAFTKGHLNVCPAKEIRCNICKNKGHLRRLCIERKRASCKYCRTKSKEYELSIFSSGSKMNKEKNFGGGIKAWTEGELATMMITWC